VRTLIARVLIYLYAMTWNATGYDQQAGPLGASDARDGTEKTHPEGSTMATEDPTNLLYSFRGSYGRLCHLTCKALHDGAPMDLVAEAFEGSGSYGTPVLNAIRTAWVAQNAAMMRAVENYPLSEIRQMTDQAAKAVAGEWFIDVRDIGMATRGS
jgi:hypothetical protein